MGFECDKHNHLQCVGKGANAVRHDQLPITIGGPQMQRRWERMDRTLLVKNSVFIGIVNRTGL